MSEREPYVRINVLLTACSVRGLGAFRSLAEGGMTLTWAPVSMRKHSPESRSEMKNRRLGLGPVTSATFTYWPSHLPNRSREVYISGLCCQRERGTSICWDVEVVNAIESGGEERESVGWVFVWVMKRQKPSLVIARLQHVAPLSHLMVGRHQLRLLGQLQ